MFSNKNTPVVHVFVWIGFIWVLGLTTALRLNCGEGKYPCANNASCIPKNYFCDGSYDCSDRSDEKGCEGGRECKIKACSHVCESASNTAKCLCFKGYTIDSDDRTCVDDDECKNSSLCSQICVNTPGSYHCKCKSGYILDEDGSCYLNGTAVKSSQKIFTCSFGKYPCDNGASCISESYVCDGSIDCSDGSDETGCEYGVACKRKRCEQVCMEASSFELNRNGAYDIVSRAHCSCKTGYIMDSSLNCFDIDECRIEKPCSHICENSPGSFKCSCYEGYHLQSDNLTCKASGEYPILISVSLKEISLTLLGPNRSYNFSSSGQNTILRAAFYGATSELIWLETFVNGGVVKRIFSNGTDTIQSLLNKDFKNPEGLAVDWLNSKVYVSDRGEGIIAACSMDCRKCTKVINDYSSSPVAIVLDVLDGSMYWSDFGSHRGIYKAGLDGSSKIAFVTKDIGKPNDLTIDHIRKTLYWGDLERAGIFYVSLKANQTNLTTRNINEVNDFVNTLEIFEDIIYYATEDSKEIKSVNIKNNNNDVFANYKEPVMYIAVYHPILTPIDSHRNPCDHISCSQFCLLAPNGTGSCACHDGYKLESDGSGCAKRLTFEDEEVSEGSISTPTEEPVKEVSDDDLTTNQITV